MERQLTKQTHSENLTKDHKIHFFSIFSNPLNEKICRPTLNTIYQRWMAVKYQVNMVHVYEYEDTYYVGRLNSAGVDTNAMNMILCGGARSAWPCGKLTLIH